MNFKNIFSIIRPHQWLKNMLVFPLFFLNYKSFEIFLTFDPLLIFISFSVVASGVYCANDVFDVKKDKNHPTKRFRPIASGDLSIYQGIALAAVFISIGLCLSLYVNLSFFFVICFYLILNIFYNLILKKIVYIDVFVLTLFYIIRIISSASLPEINLSYWFISFSFFLFLSLALLKKYIDFNYKEYSDIKSTSTLKELFFIFSTITFIASISVLISFFNSSHFVSTYSKTYLIYFLIIPYFYWMMNILTAAKLGKIHGDPIIFTITDRKSFLSIALSSLIFILSIT